MKPGQNDIFRFVSVRGPEPVYTAEPTKDLPDLEVVRRLERIDVDLANPDPKIPGLLAAIPVLGADALGATSLAAVLQEVDAAKATTSASLAELQLTLPDGHPPSLLKYAESLTFEGDYRDIANSWLTLLLTDPGSADLPAHEGLLRIAHLVRSASRNPALVGQTNAVLRLRSARVLPPAGWLEPGRSAAALRTRHEAVLPTLGGAVAPSGPRTQIAAARVDYAELVARRETLESIQVKSQVAYVDWKRATLAGIVRPTVSAAPMRILGALGGFFNRRPEASLLPRTGRPVLQLDQDYFTRLDQLLSPTERALYQRLFGGLPRPDTHAAHDVGLAPDRWMGDANRLCHQINLWEDEEQSQLPDAPAGAPGNERPLVRSVGWGDLVVARERLIGYEAREIAHVENVMPGETRLREHQRTRTVEQVVERETTQETESSRDLETTDRFELQSQAQVTIQDEYSIQAGLNTSGKYGLTRVDTSLQAGMQQSKSEARSSSQTLAKEVVSKAVERTLERVRELRRETVVEQVRELNRHAFSNAIGGQAGTDISGLYMWVEKLLEVELRHYGTRMLVEFHIPEPAVSLLDTGRPTGTRPRRPRPFTLSPTDILPENYLCLTSTYGAQDVEPPPAPYIRVGYSWSTTPNEESDEYGQDARADTIAIPRGYRPLAVTALVSAHPGVPANIDVFMAVGGEVVIELVGVNYGESGQGSGAPIPGGPVEVDLEPALSWPSGVPVVVRAVGHFDNTLVAEATVRCMRTQEALDEWRLRTWEGLRAAHGVLVQTYRNEVEQQALENFGAPPVQRPDAENRRIEAEELRKWAIKAMRLEMFNFDAVRTELDGAQEIDPLDGDLLATVARFFEEAFEWPQASYFLYPYYWARRDTWRMRAAVDAVDARHASFLRAGAARYIVPVTPGYEERVVRYLEAEGTEVERLGPPPEGFEPQDPVLLDLWLELLLDRRPELGLGSGTLDVQQGSPNVSINTDSNWRATDLDVGRELFIDGGQYEITAVTPHQSGVAQRVTLDDLYDGRTNPAANYATGSVPYGPPWVERVPTSLVILEGNRARLG